METMIAFHTFFFFINLNVIDMISNEKNDSIHLV